MQPEEELGPKWDKCIYEGVSKLAIGTLLGLFASTVIFKRKRWAFILGTGYGVGMAVAACDHELNPKMEKLPVCPDPTKKK